MDKVARLVYFRFGVTMFVEGTNGAAVTTVGAEYNGCDVAVTGGGLT